MWKNLFLILLFGITVSVKVPAQLTLTVQVPPSGLLLKAQLWNVLLLYTGKASLQVKISMSLTENRINQLVFNAVTTPFMLSEGARQIKYDDVTPVQYNYGAAFTNMDRDQNGFIPAGSYTACYTVISNEVKGGDAIAEACISVNIEPLSPPLLNNPFDGAVLENFFPQFSWLPPSPLNIFNDLSYDLVLAEVLKGQSSQDAIQKNRPVYSVGYYKNISAPYPASLPPLDTGRLYAWQVIARNNGQPVAQSEIWTFSISKLVPSKPNIPGGRYVKMKKEMDAGYSVCEGDLYVLYENICGDTVVNFKISTIEETGDPPVQDGLLPVITGYNYLTIPLAKEAKITDGSTYVLEVKNSRDETWNLKFVYHKGNSKW